MIQATLSKVGIKLGAETTREMGLPEYISLIVDDGAKTLSIRVDESQTEDNLHYTNAQTSRGREGLLITHHKVSNHIEKLMGWDYSSKSYRVSGVFDGEIATFDLMKAVSKDRKVFVKGGDVDAAEGFANLNFRVSKRLKLEFQNECAQAGINPSKVLRKYVEGWVYSRPASKKKSDYSGEHSHLLSRMPSELKKQFVEICDRDCYNYGDVVRLLIEKWVREHANKPVPNGAIFD